MLIIALLTAALFQGAHSPMQDGEIACDQEGNTLELNACGVLELEREQARMQRYLEAALDRARDSDNADPSYSEAAQAAYLEGRLCRHPLPGCLRPVEDRHDPHAHGTGLPDRGDAPAHARHLGGPPDLPGRNPAGAARTCRVGGRGRG